MRIIRQIHTHVGSLGATPHSAPNGFSNAARQKLTIPREFSNITDEKSGVSGEKGSSIETGIAPLLSNVYTYPTEVNEPSEKLVGFDFRGGSDETGKWFVAANCNRVNL